MPSPLEGITILDFTRYQNGPHATVMLSDMGADVLKVEMPGDGDPGRSLGLQPDGFCAYFEGHNRGKRSITLDLHKPEAKEIVLKLVAQVDVLTENFRPGFLDRLGYGYEELRAANPRLIYATNSGFGPRGEWRARGSFDVVAQGMSGSTIRPGDPEPVISPWGLADQVGSMVFAYSIVNALFARERFGMGQKLDVSQLGAMVTLQAFSIIGFLHSQPEEMRGAGQQPAVTDGTEEPVRRGRPNPTFGAHRAGDGLWITIGILDPKHWPNLCRAIGREDLITDSRSADPVARAEHREWLQDEMAAAFRSRSRVELIERLVAESVPCGPVYDYQGVESDPQFWDNGYLVELEHPHFEGHRTVGVPVTMSETPPMVQGPAPELGQHTEQVLLDLGYTWAQIERLHDHGVTARVD